MQKKKQTAVDYLVKELSAILGPLETKPMQDLLMVDAINKAKQMEKEQNIDAVIYGNRQEFYDGTEMIGETYYKETYED